MKLKVYDLILHDEFGLMTEPHPIYPNYPLRKLPQGYVYEHRGVYPSGYKSLDYWALVRSSNGRFVMPDGERVNICNVHLTGEIRWTMDRYHIDVKDMGYVPDNMGVKWYKGE